MRTLGIILSGSFELARLAVVSRFRLRGAYWTWRWQTAFGRGTPSRGVLAWSLLRFGAWARTMRRLRP